MATKQITAHICKSENYIKGLYKNTPGLIQLNLACQYQFDHRQVDIDLQTSTHLFKAFTETFADELEFGPLEGFWWILDGVTEEEISYCLVLLFNTTVLQYYPMQIVKEFGERWNRDCWRTRKVLPSS